MTQTESQSMHQVRNMAVGRWLDTGTVAATTITTGFKPRYVKVINTDGSGAVMMEWFEGMDDDDGILTGSDGARSLVTSNGITVSEGGFIIGLNTDVLYTSEQLSWVAWG